MFIRQITMAGERAKPVMDQVEGLALPRIEYVNGIGVIKSDHKRALRVWVPDIQ
jgi:hypothetical protein